MEKERFTVKFAESEEEIRAAQKLRYQEMLLEYRPELENDEEIDVVECDSYALLAICIDNENGQVVGTYRVITTEHLPKDKKFVTESEFNIDALKNEGQSIAELSRAVVKSEYRNSLVLILLLRFVVQYIVEKDIRYVVGTASFHGTDKRAHQKALSYLAIHHSKGSEKFYSLEKEQIPILKEEELDDREIRSALPPLIKMYTAFGAIVSSDSFTDYEFGSVDVLVVLDTKQCNLSYVTKLLKL